MKPMAIGGGVLIGTVVLALAALAEGCESRPFAKKVTRHPAAAGTVSHTADREKKDVSRRELDELLSIK